MAIKYADLKGVFLTNDVSQLEPGVLAGGRNMLKRNNLGMKRRPGFGAFDVESAAALGIGATNPRATFPLNYSGGDSEVLGFADGVLNKYDNADSFDQVTKNMTDVVPTIAHLGTYGIIASGGRALKYDGTKTPSPLASLLVADMESGEVWADVNSKSSDDTTNELAGTQCKKITLDGSVPEDETLTLTTAEAVLEGTRNGGHFDIGQLNFEIYDETMDKAVVLENTTASDVAFTRVLLVIGEAGTINGDLTVRVQRCDSSGKPDGTDLTTATLANADIAVGTHTLSVSSVTVPAGEKIAIIFDLPAQTPSGSKRHISLADSSVGTGYYRNDVDGAGGVWYPTNALYPTNGTPYVMLLGAGLDMYTGYHDDSTVRFSMFMDTIANMAIGANTYIRFKTDVSNYAEYQFVAGDRSTSWKELVLIRGVSGVVEASKGNSDFVYTGTVDWSSITEVEIKITSVTGTLNIYFDYMYLLHRFAPPSSSKVFRADSRVFLVSGKKVYYSAKNDANTFEVDTYMEFPDTVIAIVEAGGAVLFLTEVEAHSGLPLMQFPDYKMDRIAPFGCVDPKATAEIIYKGEPGAAWISKNKGILFWPGYGKPIPISLAVDEIFTAGGSNNQNLDYSRSGEIMMFFHPRYNELWMLYPTLFTGEANLKYGWVLDCRTGEWMPQLVWKDSNNLTYATVYRDPNDNLYKVLLTDTSGAVFHEGYVGSTELSNTTSKDGYVDGSTPGAGVDGYVDTWFDGPMTEAEFKEVYVKLRPMTTSNFTLNLDYRQAQLGTGVDKDTYPMEDNVTYPIAFADMVDRVFAAAAVTDVIERNIEFPEDTVAHGVSLRVGEVDSGGAVEWELLGIGWTHKERGGR